MGKILVRPELQGGATVGGVEVIDANGAIKADIKDSLASGKIYVGNASGVSAEVSVSGDVTLSNAGVVAIGANKVTGPMIAATAFFKFSGVGVDASGGAANATVTGAGNGSALLFALNMTDATDVTSSFATTCNGTNTISQLNTDLSAKTILFLFIKKA